MSKIVLVWSVPLLAFGSCARDAPDLSEPAGAAPGLVRDNELAGPSAVEGVNEATAPEHPDYDAHLAALRSRLPHDGFHAVVEPPFVVIGDEALPVIERRAERTVRWAVRLLKKSYFEKDPDEILDIWLFKDRRSYYRHATALFGNRPTTPFGYYSPSAKALVMNIETGGGTLVHEIVHPFVRANFPDCPAWLNEGLGSLYEQCREHEGRIEGLTNWRLAGLQEAIREDRLPTFETLTGTTDAGFYDGEHSDTSYGQARYLCYWLEQHGLLRKFWQEFRAAHDEDPTGHATLQSVLGREDMGAFQAEWEEYVLALEF